MAFWTRSARRDRAGHDEAPGQAPRQRGQALSPLDGADEHPTTEDPAVFPRPLSVERVAAELRRRGERFAVSDSTGDLTGMWGTRMFVLAVGGERAEVLQVRGHWNREASIERLDEILELCNEWNAQRLWPKAYALVRDDGAVMVCAENVQDLEHGVNDAQLGQLLYCALASSRQFFAELDEAFPDPLLGAEA